MDYIKLRAVNDWGRITLTYEGKVVPFPRGTNIGIKWPDESHTCEDIVYRDEKRWVSDHGNRYEVKSDIPCVVVHHRGVMRTVDLSDVLVWEPDIKSLLGINDWEKP